MLNADETPKPAQFIRCLAIIDDKLVIESECSFCGRQLIGDARVGVADLEAAHECNSQLPSAA